MEVSESKAPVGDVVLVVTTAAEEDGVVEETSGQSVHWTGLWEERQGLVTASWAWRGLLDKN